MKENITNQKGHNMDKRRHYFLVIDVETANTLEQPFVYDIGGVVCDKAGNIYETFSYIIRDIFINESELMKSAYYAEKIPTYWNDIWNHKRTLTTFYKARQHILKLMNQYNISDVCAYNAHFDLTALNTTQRWLSKSKYRYFFPYNTNIMCIWNMACQTLCQRKTYKDFCETNFLVSNKKDSPDAKNYSTSAETIYKYLTLNPNFEEEHKGYDDAVIESYILYRCYRSHKGFPDGKGIKRNCWMKVKRGA